MTVVASTLMECCQGQGQVGDHDPVNRQLFNKTIQEFRDKVVQFYDKVKTAKPVTESDVVKYMKVEKKNILYASLTFFIFRPRFMSKIEARLVLINMKPFKVYFTSSKNMKAR